jgi:DNA-binding response OmpR family regulator
MVDDLTSNNEKLISILVVEDDKNLSDINCRALQSEGYDVAVAYSLAEARAVLEDGAKSFDIILLDVKLPDGLGFELCREIREKTNTYIIFLTSATETKDEFEGLEAGGNDYLRKPYDLELLRQRIKNALQQRTLMLKQQEQQGKTLIMRDLSVNLLTQQFLVRGRDIQLSQRELALLTFFMQNEGMSLNAEGLLENIWSDKVTHDSGVVKTTIFRLRKKLEGSGFTIVFDKLDKGYRFEEE